MEPKHPAEAALDAGHGRFQGRPDPINVPLTPGHQIKVFVVQGDHLSGR
jgi:hypothetical protein